MPIETSGGIQDIYKMARTVLITPKEAEVVLVLPAGIPKDAEMVFQITPDEGERALIISYFDLTVPEEFEANIILENEMGKTLLAEPNQQPGTTEFYDPSDYGLKFFYATSIYLFVKAVSTTTDDRTVRLKFGCGRRAKL